MQRASWEQQHDESPQAYRAFCTYRDMGAQRTLLKASRAYHSENRGATNRPQEGNGIPVVEPRVQSGAIGRWNEVHRWQERARAYDAYLEREATAAKVQELRAMARRQARAGRKLQAKGLLRVRGLLPEDLKPAEALEYIVQGAKLERTALGEPEHDTEAEPATPSVQFTVQQILPSLEGLSTEQLRQLCAILGPGADPSGEPSPGGPPQLTTLPTLPTGQPAGTG
jgi:hypothetical protein